MGSTEPRRVVKGNVLGQLNTIVGLENDILEMIWNDAYA